MTEALKEQIATAIAMYNKLPEAEQEEVNRWLEHMEMEMASVR